MDTAQADTIDGLIRASLPAGHHVSGDSCMELRVVPCSVRPDHYWWAIYDGVSGIGGVDLFLPEGKYPDQADPNARQWEPYVLNEQGTDDTYADAPMPLADAVEWVIAHRVRA